MVSALRHGPGRPGKSVGRPVRGFDDRPAKGRQGHVGPPSERLEGRLDPHRSLGRNWAQGQGRVVAKALRAIDEGRQAEHLVPGIARALRRRSRDVPAEPFLESGQRLLAQGARRVSGYRTFSHPSSVGHGRQFPMARSSIFIVVQQRRAMLTVMSHPTITPAIVKPDAEWRAELTPDQYRVLREKGTERAFTLSLIHI